MTSILITGGDIPEFNNVKHYLNAQYVCIADSGLDWAIKNHINFDFVIGDMDSVQNKDFLDTVSDSKIRRLSVDKDDTDTVSGLKHLKMRRASSITLIGGGGGRLDHLLGIFSLLDTDLAPNIWITKNEIIYNVKGLISLGRYLNCDISIFPLGDVICSINSYGLKWDLDRVNWKYKSIGISNRVNLSDSWIDSGDNRILIIIPLIGKGFE